MMIVRSLYNLTTFVHHSTITRFANFYKKLNQKKDDLQNTELLVGLLLYNQD